MKRILILIFSLTLLLSACAKNSADTEFPEYQAIPPVGTVPDEFAHIVAQDLFGNAMAFPDRVIEREYVSEEAIVIRMYDYAGTLLVEKFFLRDTDAHYIDTLICTSDGGFLYVVSFYDHANLDGTWASENGVYSTIVKCSATGEIEWQKRLEDYTGGVLSDCLECEDAYYFFGEQETPETKRLGVHSYTDIHMLKLSKTGEILQTKIIGGSDYDSLYSVDVTDDGFVLNCRAQSSDGDFTDAGYWKISVDHDLNVLSMEPGDLDSDDVIGYLDGLPVRRLPDIFDGLSDGTVTAILDYGDFYLIVSRNITGVYEDQPPQICMRWNYCETVYGAYDKDGNILWKATVDSSPDYDAMKEAFYQNYSE